MHFRFPPLELGWLSMVSENKYRMIFEKSPLGIIYFDQNGLITLCNDKLSQIIDVPRENIIGSSIIDIFEDRDIVKAVETVLSGNPAHYNGSYSPASGKETIQIEVHCSPDVSVDGSLSGGICIVEDITRRMLLEDALKLDESRLEALLKLNQMTDAPMQQITDFVHEEAVRLTQSSIGYLAFLNEDETILTMHTWSNSVMKECTVPDKKFVYKVATTGLWGEPIRQRKPVIINDYMAPNPLKKGYPEGHVELTRCMSVPVFEGERIVATAGVGNKDEDYDMSDVRQLTLLMQGLWRLIQRRNALEELRMYAEELEHSNELKEIFTDIMRHDLLNPVGIVKGYTDVLLEMEEDEEKNKILQRMDENNRKLVDMIENAARFSKLDSVGEIEFNEMDIVSIFRKVIESFGPQIEEKKMSVDLVAERAYLARLNPMIEEVFSNLLSNAIKYSPQGETIIIDITDAGEEWRLSVKDSGEGVSDEDKPKLFERFKRVTKSGIKGTGLGLAIVKRIVELHGGSVGVEDNPSGKGSIFWVTMKKA